MLGDLGGELAGLGHGPGGIPEDVPGLGAGTPVGSVGDLKIALLHHTARGGIQSPPDVAAVDLYPAVSLWHAHGQTAYKPGGNAGKSQKGQQHMAQIPGVAPAGGERLRGGAVGSGIGGGRDVGHGTMHQIAQLQRPVPGILGQGGGFQNPLHLPGGPGEPGGVEVDPAAKLEEELIIRPTSETIIWNTYKNWIHSWRDLPLLCNQWCNVMRWEMRTRPFLRTSEFLWQEGHTAHATREEAEAEAKLMLKVYAEFAEKWMAVPVVQGVKSETERFAGALDTYTIEAMMQDGKALQSGTSHFLGQNFAKAFDVTYLNKENKPEYVWATSWGVSTRLIGALIMTHSDDNGLVLPPKLAPLQVVIIPIATKPEQMEVVNKEVQPIMEALRAKGISVKFDDSDNKRPGFKFADYELKGVPVRLVLGARDLENGTIEVMRRDTLEKETRPLEGIAQYVEQLLEDIQENIFNKAKAYRDERIYECDNYEEFKERVKDGGFFLCHWDGTAETEAKIKEDTQATIRCVPYGFEQTPGTDMVSGKPAKCRVIIARSY